MTWDWKTCHDPSVEPTLPCRGTSAGGGRVASASVSAFNSLFDISYTTAADLMKFADALRE